MHEPGPDRRAVLPDRRGPAAPSRRASRWRASSATSCCAPPSRRRQAAAAGRTLDEELQFLTTHGTLHLIGYDHATQEEYDAMFALQDDLLDRLAARA